MIANCPSAYVLDRDTPGLCRRALALCLIAEGPTGRFLFYTHLLIGSSFLLARGRSVVCVGRAEVTFAHIWQIGSGGGGSSIVRIAPM
jgi:hypothetical protein